MAVDTALEAGRIPRTTSKNWLARHEVGRRARGLKSPLHDKWLAMTHGCSSHTQSQNRLQRLFDGEYRNSYMETNNNKQIKKPFSVNPSQPGAPDVKNQISLRDGTARRRMIVRACAMRDVHGPARRHWRRERASGFRRGGSLKWSEVDRSGPK